MSNTNPTFHPTALRAVNEALVTLGQDVMLTQLSTTGAEPNSRKAAFLYEGARTRVLRDHAWSFARREMEFNGCSCDPDVTDGLHFRTPLPGRCARLVMCYAHGGRRATYAIVGREIRSSEPIERIDYLIDEQDLDRWSPDAYRALVLRLAADLAKPITGRINERQLQEEAYASCLADAKANDAREVNIPYDPYGDNHYVEAMRGGRGRV